MDYPNVPNLPGVPSLLRVPQGAFNLVGQGLDVTASIMSTVRSLSRSSPLRALSTISGDIDEAAGLMAGVQNTVGIYASSVLGQLTSPVARINTGLGTISSAILATPTAPLSSISSTIASTANLSGATALGFADSQVPVSLDGVESVTSTAVRGGPQWGVFKDGQSVIKADNVTKFGVKKEWTISDYPVEEGGFQSYNKVYVPFDARVRFTAGGSLENRQALLDSVEAIAGDLLKYDVVMPEKTYQSVNVVHYDIERQYNNGLGLLIIDMYLEEIRDTATAEFSTAAQAPAAAGSTPAAAAPSPVKAPKSPTAANKKSNGTSRGVFFPPTSITPGQVDPFGAGGIL